MERCEASDGERDVASTIPARLGLERPIRWLPDRRTDAAGASIFLGLSPKTLANHRTTGTGPAFVKRGRVWYYEADLLAWLATGRASSTAQVRIQRERQTPRVVELPVASDAATRPPAGGGAA